MSGESSALEPRAVVRRIVSGGQTGADRAALDAAIELGIAHGGWVPRGRWAQDGPVSPQYSMHETPSPEPAVRTEWNVRDADATLIISHGPLSGGSALTLALAREYSKPCLHIDLNHHEVDAAAEEVRLWLLDVRPEVLNVAGPRASSDPAIYDAVRRLLRMVLAPAL